VKTGSSRVHPPPACCWRGNWYFGVGSSNVLATADLPGYTKWLCVWCSVTLLSLEQSVCLKNTLSHSQELLYRPKILNL